MRVYFEKPRTTVGWKGLIADPRLDGSHDIPYGLALARRILLPPYRYPRYLARCWGSWTDFGAVVSFEAVGSILRQ